MINSKTDKVIEKPFESLLNRCQTGWETSIIWNNFLFDCVPLLYYKCHKTNFKGDVIYRFSWLDKKEKKQEKVLSIKKIINAFNTL